MTAPSSSLPGAPDNVFRIIRQHLFPPDGGATRGEARFDQQATLNQGIEE